MHIPVASAKYELGIEENHINEIRGKIREREGDHLTALLTQAMEFILKDCDWQSWVDFASSHNSLSLFCALSSTWESGFSLHKGISSSFH